MKHKMLRQSVQRGFSLFILNINLSCHKSCKIHSQLFIQVKGKLSLDTYSWTGCSKEKKLLLISFLVKLGQGEEVFQNPRIRVHVQNKPQYCVSVYSLCLRSCTIVRVHWTWLFLFFLLGKTPASWNSERDFLSPVL